MRNKKIIYMSKVIAKIELEGNLQIEGLKSQKDIILKQLEMDKEIKLSQINNKGKMFDKLGQIDSENSFKIISKELNDSIYQNQNQMCQNPYFNQFSFMGNNMNYIPMGNNMNCTPMGNCFMNNPFMYSKQMNNSMAAYNTPMDPNMNIHMRYMNYPQQINNFQQQENNYIPKLNNDKQNYIQNPQNVDYNREMNKNLLENSGKIQVDNLSGSTPIRNFA